MGLIVATVTAFTITLQSEADVRAWPDFFPSGVIESEPVECTFSDVSLGEWRPAQEWPPEILGSYPFVISDSTAYSSTLHAIDPPDFGWYRQLETVRDQVLRVTSAGTSRIWRARGGADHAQARRHKRKRFLQELTGGTT